MTSGTGGAAATATGTATDRKAAAPSTGQLVGQLSEQVSRLVRDELKLAQAEVARKSRKGLLGAGLFGAAGVVALFAAAVLTAAAVIGLANAVPAWLAALIVGGALLAVAAVLAVIGKKDLGEQPPVPTEAVQGVKLDAATIKEATRR